MRVDDADRSRAASPDRRCHADARPSAPDAAARPGNRMRRHAAAAAAGAGVALSPPRLHARARQAAALVRPARPPVCRGSCSQADAPAVRGTRSPRACCSPIAPAPRRGADVERVRARRRRRSRRRCRRRSSSPDAAARSRARRSARSLLRRPRRADRPDRAQERAGHDRRHAAARRRRGGGLPARRRRPLRLRAGGDRRDPVHAAELSRRSRSRSKALRLPSTPRRRACCSTCRASPIRCACSTR